MIESFNSAAGRSIVAADTAVDLGHIHGFILDDGATRVDALHVDGYARGAQVVHWAAISSFGSDAVMVRTAADIVSATGDREVGTVKGTLAAIGKRVLTTEGFAAGTVEDVQFDSTTGLIKEIVTDQGIVDAKRLRSIGSYAAVIDAAVWSAPSIDDLHR